MTPTFLLLIRWTSSDPTFLLLIRWTSSDPYLLLNRLKVVTPTFLLLIRWTSGDPYRLLNRWTSLPRPVCWVGWWRPIALVSWWPPRASACGQQGARRASRSWSRSCCRSVPTSSTPTCRASAVTTAAATSSWPGC